MFINNAFQLYLSAGNVAQIAGTARYKINAHWVSEGLESFRGNNLILLRSLKHIFNPKRGKNLEILIQMKKRKCKMAELPKGSFDSQGEPFGCLNLQKVYNNKYYS